MLLESNDPRLKDAGQTTIGDTPLLRLSKTGDPSRPIFVKLENTNPGGSIRDRYIHEIVDIALRAGQLQRGDTIVLAGIDDSAVSAASMAAQHGLKTVVFAPQSSVRRLVPLVEQGATIHWTDDALGLDGAVQEAAAFAREAADRAYVDGYRRTAVKEAYAALAREIVTDLGEVVLGGFVTSVTTGATFREVSRLLRATQPQLEVRGARLVQNEFATAEENPFIRQVNMSDVWRLRDQLVEDEGLLLGPKGAACVLLCLELQAEIPEGRAVVALNPDSGSRYVGWENQTLFRTKFR
ncbi:MAG: pyridoxal-phosphate dependent enzyme [bacterium]